MAIVKTHFKPTGTPAEREAYALHVHGLEVVNNTGSSIAAGKLVYVSGWSHTLNLPKISMADADVVAGSATFVTPVAIPDGQTGFVEKSYTLTGVNTTGSALGDPVYLSTTAGTWTLTAPTTAGAIVQVVGRVDVHDSASAGVVKIVLDASSITSLPMTIGGVSVTADAAELNLLDGTVAGTVVASKAVAVDGNKDVGDFRNVDVTNLDAGASGTAGSVDIFPATALKGKLTISCSNQTGDTAVTLSADEMGQATAVHIPDPGGATAYVALAATEAQSEVLSGVVPGTVTASKALVVDSNKDLTNLRNLTLGTTSVAGSLVISDGANPVANTTLTTALQTANLAVIIPDPGAIVTSYVALSTAALTAAEVDVLDGVTPGTVAASKAVVVDANKDASSFRHVTTNSLRTDGNVGTAAAGSTAVEYGDSYNHTTVLTVSTTLPAIAGGANLGIGKLLYTLPAGNVTVNSARMSLAITQTQANITADTPDGGLGTTIASGVVATLDGTPAFENILTGQTFNDCNGTAEVKAALPTTIGYPLLIETAGDHTIYFNVADGWAAGGDAAALLTGTVVLNWTFLG